MSGIVISTRSSAALITVAALALAGPVHAETATGTIGVSLNVTNACVVNGAQQLQSSIGSMGDINFPDQPGIFGNIDGQLVGSLGTLQVLCSPGLAPQMTVGAGVNDAAGKRRMASNGNVIDYRLFSDAQRTAEIGIGSRISLGTSTTTPFNVPIYARVTSGGAVLAAGHYSDTVQVTLAW